MALLPPEPTLTRQYALRLRCTDRPLSEQGGESPEPRRESVPPSMARSLPTTTQILPRERAASLTETLVHPQGT